MMNNNNFLFSAKSGVLQQPFTAPFMDVLASEGFLVFQCEIAFIIPYCFCKQRRRWQQISCKWRSGDIYSLHSRARKTSLETRVEVMLPSPGRGSRQAIEHSTTCETDRPIQLASYSYSSYERSSWMNKYFYI